MDFPSRLFKEDQFQSDGLSPLSDALILLNYRVSQHYPGGLKHHPEELKSLFHFVCSIVGIPQGNRTAFIAAMLTMIKPRTNKKAAKPEERSDIFASLEVVAQELNVPADHRAAFARALLTKAEALKPRFTAENPTLARLSSRYAKRLREYVPPKGGVSTIEEARAANLLARTHDSLTALQTACGVEVARRDPVVTEAATQAADFYRRQRTAQVPTRSRPRSRAAPSPQN